MMNSWRLIGNPFQRWTSISRKVGGHHHPLGDVINRGGAMNLELDTHRDTTFLMSSLPLTLFMIFDPVYDVLPIECQGSSCRRSSLVGSWHALLKIRLRLFATRM